MACEGVRLGAGERETGGCTVRICLKRVVFEAFPVKKSVFIAFGVTTVKTGL